MGHDIVLVAVGCLTGVLAGMLGAGGGFATVVLLLAAGATPHQAVGTGLVYLGVMGFWGSFVHLKAATVNRRLALAIGGSAAVAALIGAELTEAMSNQHLALALGLFTALVAGITLGTPYNRRPLAAPGPSRPALAKPLPGTPDPGGRTTAVLELAPPAASLEIGQSELTWAAVAGGLIGFCKGLFAVGAAFVVFPLISSVARVRREVAVGSTILAILVASGVGGLRHVTMHNVDAGMLGALIPGGLIGSWLGTKASAGMSAVSLRRVFVALMTVATVYLLAFAASYV
jgi:hypothetical protein